MNLATYVRVSTQDQSLERQLTATHEYAIDRLGVDRSAIETYRDKSTGTNTSRDGYQDMVAAAEAGEFDAIVVKSISRIARSIRDLERTVERLRDSDVALHIIDEGFVLDPTDDDPMQRAMFRLMGVFAELEADLAQQRTKEGLAARMQNEDYHHGPPPIGFTKDDGRLIESDDYHRVCAILDQVARGDLSKRKAARELDTTRKTVRSAINERPELYGLEEIEG